MTRTAAPAEAGMISPQPFSGAPQRFAAGTDTPRDLLERAIARIDAFESKIGAFTAVDLAASRKAADASTARWHAKKPLSPIDGMPIGVKDIMETVGLPTEMGSDIYKGWMSNRDAAAVAALHEAGAVIFGKTVTTEFANTEPRGTRNPWDLTRTPGGSSSGSAAAVAAGFMPAALGTQVVGSILRPSSYCGVYGFKPTYGAINRGGSLDYLSQSCTGPIAASLADCWNMAWQISSRVGGDPGYPGLYGPEAPPAAAKPKRLALLETPGWAKTVPAAKEALLAAIAQIEKAGITVARRSQDPAIEALEQGLVGTVDATRSINAWEWRWPLNTYRAHNAAKMSASALDRLKNAEAMTLDDYRALIAKRSQVRALHAALATNYDAAITLTVPAPAPVGLQSTGDPIFVVTASYLGVPAVTLPYFMVDGLPMGLQVIGYGNADASLFGTCAWLETLGL